MNLPDGYALADRKKIKQKNFVRIRLLANVHSKVMEHVKLQLPY